MVGVNVALGRTDVLVEVKTAVFVGVNVAALVAVGETGVLVGNGVLVGVNVDTEPVVNVA